MQAGLHTVGRSRWLAFALAFATECAAAPPQEERAPTSGLVRQKYEPRGSGRAGLDKPTADAIDAGLRWLARHQDPDGRWDADQFMKHDRDGAPCDGPGDAWHDVGVTGLALLAFLANGDSLTIGSHDEVWNGLKWLRSQQQANGMFGKLFAGDFIYDHAIATYAMCEAAAIANDPVLRQSAQQGIRYLEFHRNPYSVWRYQPRDNDNDLSVSGWCILAYTTAAAIGLEVNDQALRLAATFLDQVSDPTGAHGYSKAGEGSAREPGDHATRFPTAFGAATTAIGLECRFFLGQDPEATPVMKAAAELIAAKLPEWNARRGTIDLYYWFHASQALFQAGEPYWTKWRRALRSALLPSQRTDGNFAGSWDAVSAWGHHGGRVYATTMAVMSLQAEFRYARMLTLAPLPNRPPFVMVNRAWLAQRYGQFASLLDAVAAKDEPGNAERDAIAGARVDLARKERDAAARVDQLRESRAYFDGPEQLAQVAERFGQLPAGIAARELLAAWRRDPAVNRETTAMQRYRALAERAYKADDARTKREVRAQLEALVRQYGGTQAAEQAAALITKLQ